jgi:RHS repeat-associated protein/uncharacterized repeat protein (TIGR01451 family)
VRYLGRLLGAALLVAFGLVSGAGGTGGGGHDRDDDDHHHDRHHGPVVELRMPLDNYTLVASKTTASFRYLTYRADLVNPLPRGFSRAWAVLVHRPHGTHVESGLHFGPAEPGQTVTSLDTFTVRHYRWAAFDPSKLVWTVRFKTANRPPVAHAGPDQTVAPGARVTLDGSASADPDGDRLKFRWRFVAKPHHSRAWLSHPHSVRPTFVVDREGTYVLELVVSDGRLAGADQVRISTRNSRPIAQAGPDQTVPRGATVVLDGSASSDVDGQPLTFRWTVLERPPLSQAALDDPVAVGPAFIADLAGRYVVQLIVNDGLLDSLADTVQIDTLNSPPAADAGPDQTLTAGATVELDGTASTDADADPLTFRWSFTSLPDGSAATLSDPQAPQPTFLADLPGLYVVQLIVNDGLMDSVADTAAITATQANRPPVADAGPDQTVEAGLPVQLDGSASADPDDDALTFRWSVVSQPADAAATLSDPAAERPTFVPPRAGLYVLQLVVDDGTVDSAADTVAVTATEPNEPPVADAGPDQTVARGVTVRLDGGGSSDPEGTPLGFSWTLLTRPDGSTASLVDSATATPTFVADVNGAYVAQLTVGDGALTSAPETVTVTVEDGADLRIFFESPPAATPAVGGTVSFALRISNLGPASTTGISAHVPIPAGYTFVSSSLGTYDPATGVWTIPSLSGSGFDFGRLGLSLRVNPAGPYDLTATITGSSQPDPDPANNTALFVVAPNPNADLRIFFESPPAATPAVGGTVSFTLRISNLGPASTTGIGAHVPIPAGYTFVSSSLGTYDPATGVWTIPSLSGSGFDFGRLGLSLRVNPAGPYDLSGTITGSSQPDPDPANNTALFVVAPDPNADLHIFVETPPPATRAPGQTASLMLRISNLGPAATTGVAAHVSIPAGYTFVSSSLGTYDPATGVWTIPSLSGSGFDFGRLGLSLRVNATGSLDLTATITASSQPDPNLANNTVTAPRVNRPPVANAGPDQPVATGTPVTLDGSQSSDADGDAITFAWAFTQRAANSVATLSGADTASPSFVADQPGTYLLELTVRDASGVASAPDTVAVSAAVLNRPPVILSTPVTAGVVGQPYRYDVRATDPDAGDTLAYSLIAAPAGMTIDPTGAITWTPGEAQGGPQAVTVRVQDQAGLFATQGFAVQVSSAANQAPEAVDDRYEVRIGESLGVPAPGVIANDADADGAALTATLVDPPVNGAVIFNPDGSFTYAPHTLVADNLVRISNLNLASRMPGVTATASSEVSDGPAAAAIDDTIGTAWRNGSGGGQPLLEIHFPQAVTVTRLELVGSRTFPAQRNSAGIFQLFDGSGVELFTSGNVDIPPPSHDVTIQVPSLAGVRRVRFTPTARPDGQPVIGSFDASVEELRVIGSAVFARAPAVDEPNLAHLLPTRVNASSFIAPNVPEAVIDDSAGTNWFAGSFAAGEFLELVFPVDVTVTEIRAEPARGRPDGFGTSLLINQCTGRFTLFDAAGAELFDSGVANVPFQVAHPHGGGIFETFVLAVPNVANVRRVRYTTAGCVGGSFPPGFEELRVLGTAPVTRPAFRLARKFNALAGREIHSTPLVVNLTDDNADGRIDRQDVPDIVVLMESTTSQLTGEIKVLSGDDGHELLTIGGPNLVSPWSEAAVGDIDGDGFPDIVAVHSDGSHLIAFAHTGEVKWISDANPMPQFRIGDSTLVTGAVAIANLDATGPPEIVVGASVFDADGRLLGDGRTLGGTTGGTGLRSAISAVADLDLDGVPELVAGPTAYRLVNGALSLVWRRADRPDGYVAIGNFDGDPEPEIVVVANGVVYMLNHDGTDAEVWNPPSHAPAPVPGGGQGGAPTVADVDGGGVPEIGVAGAVFYTMFNRDGTVRWQSAVRDRSSNATGSTVFDFDGDGSVEVVYRDELFLRVYRGGDGVLLAKVPISSSTWSEMPVVADVDNDGRAELVVVGDPFTGDTSQTGVHVFEDPADQWARTRRIWNQHAYHVTNVDEDGRIPLAEIPHWLVPGLNHFRLNAFVPGESAEATDRFTYQLTDGTLLSNVATVRLAIRPQNSAPAIVSTPVATAATGVRYTYAAQAADPDAGDVLTFSLPAAPAGMTIDPASGLIQWTPAAGQLSTHDVVVRVQDGRGLFALQAYTVQVASPVTVPNVVGQPEAAAATTITGANLLVGSVGTRNTTTTPAGAVFSQDPAAGALAAPGSPVDLVVSLGPPPVGTVPNVVGLLQAGAQADIAAAGFLLGAVGNQHNAVVPLGVVLGQDPAAGTIAPGGSLVSLVVSLGTPPGDIDADGDGVSGNQGDCDDTNPSIRPDAVDTPGDGIDQNCNGRDSIADDDTPPTVAIESPAENADVSVRTDVIGTVTDANLLRYTLEVAAVDGTGARVISSGTAPVTGGVLGRLDPTLLENGLYRVRLTAEDVNGNTSFAERIYQVTGEAKPGLVAVGFIDLQVPVTGIPITVVRTYDNRVKTRRDFGIGWRLHVRTGTYRNNVPPGQGWIVTGGAPPLGLPCQVTTETRAHVTEVRLSDREFYRFRPRLTGLAAVVGGCVGTVTYEFVDGVLPGATLEVLGNADIIYTSGDEVTEFDGSTSTGILFDPPRVRLTLPGGRTVDLDRSGITDIQDANGHRLTIGDGGIVHSSGKSIAFVRDAEGRIVRITDPRGLHLTYEYDGAGDLVAFVDQAGNRTTFAYDTRHNLVELRDPLGNRAFRGEYDSEGRLIAMIDGHGRRIEFARDLDGRQEVVTDARGNVRRVLYDEFGNVQTDERAVTVDGQSVVATWRYVGDRFGNELVAVDPDGVRTEAAYDRQNPLEQTVDPHGLALRTRRTYDAGSRATSVTNPAGEVMSVTYDVRGNLRQFRDFSGMTLQFEPDDDGNPARMVEPTGTVNQLTYDRAGNVVREEQRDSAGNLLSRRDYAYDPSNNRVSETVFRTVDGALQGFTTSYTYDALNRVVAVRDPAGNVTQTQYDAAGLKVATVDALGRRTDYVYDAVGSLLRTDFPDGTSERRDYDESGNLTRLTDRAGRATALEYDELNRLVRTLRPDGMSVQRVYSPAGRLVASIDARGHRTDFGYDGAGRLVTITHPEVFDAVTGVALRPQTRRELDAAGRPTALIDAGGCRTGFSYDAGGHLVRTTYADGTSRRTDYDALNRVAARHDEAGRTTRLEYDGLDRLVAVIDAAGGRTTYRYDEAGNRLSQTDALGRTTLYRHDALNRVVERTLPGGERERFAYDAVGNQVAHTDFNGARIAYEYDVLNRLARKALPDGTEIAYTYTATGHRQSVTDGRGATSYDYDVNDRLVRVTHPGGDVVTYVYDPDNRLRQLSSPAGDVTYEYDALGRLVQTTAPQGTTEYGYDAVGNLVQETAASGVTTQRSHDVRNRLTEIRHMLGGATLGAFTYALSPTGRRLRSTEADGTVETYAYDALERLVGEARNGSRPRTITYEYDAVGNRTQMVRDGAPTTFEYDASDRLLRAGTTVYTYDANGNVLTRTSPPGAVSRYTWGTENRLVAVEGTEGSATFAYDADGNLVERRALGAVTRFLVDPNNLTGFAQVLEERDEAAALLAHYVYSTALRAMTRGGASSFPLVDGLGSVRLLTDDTAAVTDTYEYDGFGSLVAASGSSANAYRFTGERLDPTLGFYNLRARWMDPATGRFLSRDQFQGILTDPLTLHGYLYAGADPVNHRDPSGYFTLAEISEVNSIMGNLARQSLSILRLYDNVQTVVDILYIVENIGQIAVQALEFTAFTTPGIGFAPNPSASLAGTFSNIGQALADVDPEEAAAALVRNTPELFTNVLRVWRTRLLSTGPSTVHSFDLYLPNPVLVPGGQHISIRSPFAIKVRGINIPIHLLLGGADFGRLVGGGYTANRGGRNEVWAMDYSPIVANQISPSGSLGIAFYGHIAISWPDRPYQFRVMRP